jgi:regulation of enolase protein 1 (concanavalin A-like superfamily)
MTQIPWDSARWLHEPAAQDVTEPGLVVTTKANSDFWRETGYGFTHYSGHALLTHFPPDSAMEVEFSADWTHQFDQAGVMLHADERHWVKAGVEVADGVLGLGAVVTDERSDWSVGHVPEWTNQRIRIRLSRTRDALTIRARTAADPWRLVRLAPINPALHWFAGPFAASPTREGLSVTFHSWQQASPDSGIHSTDA